MALELAGMVTESGELRLEKPIDLPPGPALVAIRPVPPAAAGLGENLAGFLRRLHEEHVAAGGRFRSKEEIDATVDAMLRGRGRDEE